MVQEIKSALDLCLTKGIIPDDIHLGNIMVSPDSQTLKIIDVGDFYFCQKQFLHHISLKFKKTNRLYSILEETLSH
jgi:serine/threonine protein kinase